VLTSSVSSLYIHCESSTDGGITRHKAIIAYLSSNSLPATAEALRQELNLGDSFDATKSKKYEGLLEKKWTSVVRLQKKVCT
jgi:hypothetical protein